MLTNILKMKKIIFSLLIITIFSCNTDDETIPSTFDVSVSNIDIQSANISWNLSNPPDKVYYDIILLNVEIASEISANNYSFINLDIGINYSGKVIAKYPNGSRSVGEFSFGTKNIDLNPELDKLLFDLTTPDNLLKASVKWNKVFKPDGEESKYSVFLDGNTVTTNLTENFYEFSSLSQSTSYRITILAEIGNSEVIEEINIQTPSLEDESELALEITANYTGYTAFNLLIPKLNPDYRNSVRLISHNPPYIDEIIREDYNSNELLIADFPLSIVPNYGDSFTVEITSMKNDIIGSISGIDITLRSLYKLPDDDLTTHLFNIQDTSVNVVAKNCSNVSEYDPSTVGYEDFKVYIDDQYIGEYKCYFAGIGGSASFPTFDNLTPGAMHILKVEVDYDNQPVDTNYEPNLELTTYKEFEFTTYEAPLASKLDVNIINLTSTSFDFTWRTDLSELYNCSIFDYDYNFILEIDGIENQNFDSSTSSINVSGLLKNTTYSIKLTCNFYFVQNNNIIDSRVSEFEITTLE